MNHPANASSRTSSTAATDTLRPRARKLISGLGDDESSTFETTSAPSTRMASPRHSRPSSPLPSKYPSRTSVRDSPQNSFNRETTGKRMQSPGSFASIWGGSWSGLQGFASSLMGSEAGGSTSTSRAGSKSRTLDASSPSRPRSGLPSEWGPSERIQIGAGTKEERDTLVRAAKRKELLRANGHGSIDASGRHKRRTSDDLTRLAGSVQPSEDDDRDALVYVHRVKPNDTFIGLTIKYNCQAAVIRKANRLWPNDPVQSRKTILLPVDACGVKGRPVPGPEPIIEEQDLLGDPNETLSMHESPKEPPFDVVNGWHKSTDHEDTTQHSSSLPASSAVSTAGDSLELQWKHESWALFPNEKEPTEIARLPRRQLGYFPRARRKSNPFSDAGTGTPRLTPNTSLDIPRIPPSPGSAQSEAYAALRPGTSRQRSHSNSPFPTTTLFSGPGGVGTLGKNVRIIGPGKDRLNELLGPHLPNVAPPERQTVFTPWNPGIRDEDLMAFAEANPAAVEPYSDDIASGMDFQEMTGKVERWVRKTVKRAGSAYAASASVAQGKGVQGMAAGSGVGDLIELTDSFEIGDGDHADDLIDIGHRAEGSSAAEFGAEGIRGRRMARHPINADVSGKSGKGD